MLKSADSTTQMAVGHSVNFANSLFLKNFESVDSFRLLPQSLKIEYIHNLTELEEKKANEDPHFALGVALFKMWLGAVAANDDKLASQIFEELSFFSRVGDLPPG